MNKLFSKYFCFALTITLASGECVWNSTEIAHRFSSFVLIKLRNTDQYCGGVIIDEQHILTSKEGLKYDYYNNLAKPSDVSVHLDFLNCDHSLPVSKIYTEEYSPFGSNLAILKLNLNMGMIENARPGVAPAKVSFFSYKKQKSCAFLNWDRVMDTNNYTLTQNYTLKQLYFDTKFTSDSASICAAPQDINSFNPLKPRQGSALFCNGELVGIGYNRYCPFPEDGEAFAKVYSYLKWILKTLEKSRFEDMNYVNSSATFTVSAIALILSLLAML